MWKPALLSRADYLACGDLGWRPVAFTALEELNATYAPDDEPWLDRIYAGLSTATQAFKITRRNRFPAMAARLADEVRARFPGRDRVAVHDAGASNGITSLELYDALSAARPVRVHASDYFDRLDLVTPPGSAWTVAFDGDGRPLQAAGYGFALTLAQPEARRYPINRLLAARVRGRVLPRAADLLARREGVREVPLFHPEFLARAADDPNLTRGRHDLFAEPPGRFDVVRTMNVLNRCYFGDDRLRLAVRRAAESLADGGLFVAGRSVDEEDGRLAATVFVKEGGGLRPAWDVNDGSELKPLAAGLRA